MIWFPKRLPDDQMTPFKPGDLIVPRETEYYEDASIFLGLSWEHYPKVTNDCTTGTTSVEDGWVVYPYVYSPGRYHGKLHYKGKVWGTDWTFIQHCELIEPIGERPKPSKHWEKHYFKYFIPPPKEPIARRILSLFRRQR